MSALTFSNVEAKNASPSTIRQIIADVFKANNDACFIECRPYLMSPGVDGSTQWDHCEVVNIILKHDKDLHRAIAAYMVENNIYKSALWRYVSNALKRAGFDMRQGRVAGLLESDDEE